MVIPNTLGLKRFDDQFNDDISCIDLVLGKSIEEVLKPGLDNYQRLIEVLINDVDTEGEKIFAEDDLVLQELCNTTCDEQITSTKLYERVTSYMNLAIADGVFTAILQKNAAGAHCTYIESASVEMAVYDAPKIVVVTSSPSSQPSVWPSSNPSSSQLPTVSVRLSLDLRVLSSHLVTSFSRFPCLQ